MAPVSEVVRLAKEFFHGYYNGGVQVAAVVVIVAHIVWITMQAVRKARGPSKMTDQDWERALEKREAVTTIERAPGYTEAAPRIPYQSLKYPEGEMVARSKDFYELLNKRRTVRDYSPRSFPIEVLENCILAAGTAPSGANLQPWTYVIVKDPAKKKAIRELVEQEEEINYARRMRESWKADLSHLGTDASKPYLDVAPYLVCVFKHAYRVEDGEKLSVYYPEQSVGISVGMFQAALHNAGLVTLTSTPMGAEAGIRELLGRPAQERLYLLMPVGYPADGVTVPNITRKPLQAISAAV